MPHERRERKDKPGPKEFDVAYNQDGDLSLYSGDSYYGPIQRPNVLFVDHLEYYGYHGASGGNSYIEFISLNSGCKFHMFMSDFDDVLLGKRFVDNQIIGQFYVCRKGQRQGLRLSFDKP